MPRRIVDGRKEGRQAGRQGDPRRKFGSARAEGTKVADPYAHAYSYRYSLYNEVTLHSALVRVNIIPAPIFGRDR